MKSLTTIRDDLTLQKYGYTSDSLNIGSHNKVIVECNNCKTLIPREYRYLTKYHQCSSVKDGKKRCFKCKTWMDYGEFPKCPRASGGVGKMCKKCHNSHPSVIKYEINRLDVRSKLFDNDIKSYLTKRCYATKNQAKYKQVPFNLTSEYLINQWETQNGKCFYTNLPMVSHGKDFGWQRWDAPSLDRLEPDKGYIEGNVVWCCFGVNSFKGRLNETQFKERLQQITWWYKYD